jgi:hypothetical protein
VSASATSPSPASISGASISATYERTCGSSVSTRSRAKYGWSTRRKNACSGRSTSSGGRLVPNCGPPELLKRSEARAMSTTSA